MYFFYKSNEIIGTYKNMKTLFKENFWTIIQNINFHNYIKLIQEYNIKEIMSKKGYQKYYKRNKRKSHDEFMLLNDIEKKFVLNNCLLNGYYIRS